MSAASAELDSAPRGISAGAIVRIAGGLMILSALAAVLILSRGGAIDGAAALEAAFGVRTLPLGLQVVQAHEMPGGEKLIVLENPVAGPEPERAPSPATTNDGPRFDWTKIPLGAAGATPRRVTVLLLRSGASKDRIDAQFQITQWRDLTELPASGGLVPIDSGKLAWRGFDAVYVHERSYEAGGTFRDALRVNVSLEKQPCVLTAFWSRGDQGSKAVLETLIAGLAPR